MPYVATADGWQINAPALWEVTKADRFFKPVAGTLPSGVVTDNSYSATSQTYTNATTYLWDSGVFNTQGQRWAGVSGTNTDGCKNVATNRTSSGVTYNHVTEFEFLFTGQNFDIVFVGSSYYDSQVYMEYGGKMYKVAGHLSGTTTGVMYRHITLAATYHGRVRVHLGGGAFVGVKCEQSAIVKQSPDRVYAIADGDKWLDGAGIKQASGTSFLTAGVVDYLFEKTGWVWGRRAQDSGFFYNGSGTVTDDTAASDGTTRFFSADRKGILLDDLAAKPLVYLLVGALADAGRSGANGASNGTMAQRAKACYDWVRAQDAYVHIVHVSPLPFTGAGSAGATDGPPTADTSSDFNRREQTSAIATVQKAAYLNAFGPTNPAWSGAGSNGSPAASQQAALVGADGLNPALPGANYLAGWITSLVGQLQVSTLRGLRAR